MSHPHAPGMADGGPPHAHEGHGEHGNPEDLASYIAKMEDPSRAEWQKPDQVIQALNLKPGQVVCDIGAGPGYFSLRFASSVGASGWVYAVDVEPRILEVLDQRLEEKGVRNVTPVLASGTDPRLPPGVCDQIVIIDTYHHLEGGPAYLRRLVRSLRPGGHIVNIDFHKRELPVGPPLPHKISRDDFLRDAKAAGLKLVEEPTFLPYQYFMILALAS